MSLDKLRNNIFRFKVAIIIVLALFVYEGSYIYTLPPLARELYFYKTFHRELVTDASRVIGRHFQQGETQEEALAYLRRQGFKIYPVKTTQPRYEEEYKDTYTGVFPLRASFSRVILTSYEAQIYLKFDDEQNLVGSYGYVKMNHL